jgi:hypothetical protein
MEAKQLDEGIGDTFVSVGVKNGAHTSVSSALRTEPESLAQHTSTSLRLGQLQAAARRASVGWI